MLYASWPLVQVDVLLVLAASELEERHHLSFSDALVLEAAGRAGATRLVTEDLQRAGSSAASGSRIPSPDPASGA